MASAEKFGVGVRTVVRWAGQQGKTVDESKTEDDETKSGGCEIGVEQKSWAAVARLV